MRATGVDHGPIAPLCRARIVVQIPRGHAPILGECMNRTLDPSGRCWRHRPTR